MLGRLISKSKSFHRRGREFFKQSSLTLQTSIDKYQIVKRFFILGTVINLYFCYDNMVKYMIYNDISEDIVDKFKKWDESQQKNKESVLELMRQMELMKKQREGINSLKEKQSKDSNSNSNTMSKSNNGRDSPNNKIDNTNNSSQTNNINKNKQSKSIFSWFKKKNPQSKSTSAQQIKKDQYI